MSRYSFVPYFGRKNFRTFGGNKNVKLINPLYTILRNGNGSQRLNPVSNKQVNEIAFKFLDGPLNCLIYLKNRDYKLHTCAFTRNIKLRNEKGPAKKPKSNVKQTKKLLSKFLNRSLNYLI